MIARMTEPSAVPAPASPPRKRRHGRTVVGALILFVGGCGIGTGIGSAGKSTTTTSTRAVTVTPAAVTVSSQPEPAVTVTQAGAAAVPVPAETVTVTGAPVPGPTVTVVQTAAAGGGSGAGAASAGFPGDGTYLVGTDVKAGTYRSATPSSGNCYWARLSNTDGTGDTSGILANNNSAGSSIVTIKASDKAFNTSGCETWTKVN